MSQVNKRGVPESRLSYEGKDGSRQGQGFPHHHVFPEHRAQDRFGIIARHHVCRPTNLFLLTQCSQSTSSSFILQKRN